MDGGLPAALFAAGGVGLFLLGMQLMTEGLRALAGAGLRRRLADFTRTPLTGALTGAAATALVQSSSAVTVATVGFVAAGLMTFPHALGVIFGANLGTTFTGWMVALIGFKLQLGQIAAPLALAGALLRLFGRGRVREAGLALAGFALLFIGISAMQDGLEGFRDLISPADLPRGGVGATLILVAAGAVITLITQSSSAGVATALVALQGGVIAFPQAAALVIGMQVGTTFTALLATLGGSTAAKRTGRAHLVYNLFNASVALGLLAAFGPWIEARLQGAGPGDAQLALVGFHTAFNLVSLALALPLSARFARLMIRLTPESGAALTRRLDDRLTGDPGAALDAAAGTIGDLARVLTRAAGRLAAPGRGPVPRATLARVEGALSELAAFLDAIPAERAGAEDQARLTAALHALDHLTRLQHRCAQAAAREATAAATLDGRLRRLARVTADVAERLPDLPAPEAAAKADRLRRLLRAQREGVRARALSALAARRIGPESALLRLDAIRWLHRVAYHLWRIAEHGDRVRRGLSAPEPSPEPAAGTGE